MKKGVEAPSYRISIDLLLAGCSPAEPTSSLQATQNTMIFFRENHQLFLTTLPLSLLE